MDFGAPAPATSCALPMAFAGREPANVVHVTVNALKSDELQRLIEQAEQGAAHATA